MTIWTVPAVVQRVIDGDTIVADLDLGWKTWRLDQRVRLEGASCPELDTPDGVTARDFVVGLLPKGSAVTVASHRLDQYGRVYGEVIFQSATGQKLNLSAELIAREMAVAA